MFNVNALNYICERLIGSDDFLSKYNQLFSNIASNFFSSNLSNCVSVESYNSLLKFSDLLSNSDIEEHRKVSLNIMTALYEVYGYDENFKIYLKSVMSKLGLFAAEEEFLDDQLSLTISTELESYIKRINQKVSNSDAIFTDSQFKIYSKILDSNVLSFSGPTSLGKSFLLKHAAIELLNTQNNVVFVLPTKALLDEYLVDIRAIFNERDIDNINLTKSVSGVDVERSNIMIFTQERLNNFLHEPSYNDMVIDTLIVDEAHKLGEKNSRRGLTLYKVISKSLDRHRYLKILFSSPVISNPASYFDSFNLNGSGESLQIKESPVSQRLYFADTVRDKYTYYSEVDNKFYPVETQTKFSDDFDLITSVGNSYKSNLIYISSKTNCLVKAAAFFEYYKSVGNEELTDDELLVEAEVIRDQVHDSFNLCDLLKYGIAFHHGSLPSFIRKRVEDLYSRKKIKYIFCTSTLLEGVNLPTQNVFIYPFSKNDRKNTNQCNLNFWNLAGRAGRYRNELNGNIICIDNSTSDWDEVKSAVEKQTPVEVEDHISPILESKRRIMNFLEGKVKKPTPIIQQLCSVIISDVRQYMKDGNMSNVLQAIPDKSRKDIISASVNYINKHNINSIDYNTYSSSHAIDTEKQVDAYHAAKNKLFTLTGFSREEVFSYLLNINKIYKIRPSNKSLNQLVNIVYGWLLGNSLKKIIKDSIDYSTTVQDMETFEYVTFEPTNYRHVNYKIMDTIGCIENETIYKLEMYCSHYYQIYKNIHGEDKAGINIAPFLECGTTDPKVISIQDFGFSRIASLEIRKRFIKYISLDDNNRVRSVNFVGLMREVDENSLLGKEIKWLV
ncbi:DEAD/DEAH box helicase [Vibrio alginolyticus]|jgi:hypothetical protein|uniref:DEAD/DEAH box helicase n=1 Tax=Vibrio harveyi group TaxID=717610 RepID=UPI00081A8D4A|nr:MULTISPECIES: DEAD/DEAH box helicase [Vibrio harveyi group]ANZ13312.1 ATP-dependent RNA helicase DEAD box family protein [Vibrio parahaemolyticus]EJE4210423.1 DEAD/DEAH box helicase [Vibrio parahaemolyticus]EJG1645772.1 DEAD/DEAH box helicase [Vibrio parahaemolyticus]MBM5027702.1 DEAD/DEAH box helicase [Vibrio parahaemolyticus]QKS94924.1 DEAD/DEAH box helicase [Vibrio alginolyticus]